MGRRHGYHRTNVSESQRAHRLTGSQSVVGGIDHQLVLGDVDVHRAQVDRSRVAHSTSLTGGLAVTTSIERVVHFEFHSDPLVHRHDGGPARGET